MKQRKIILHKHELVKEFESLTYKFAETALQDDAVKDSVQADTETTLDGTVVIRLMDLRYKILKSKISFSLVKTDRCVVDDTFRLSPTYEFNLDLEDDFDDNKLDIAVTFFHEYIVKGALLDWYNRLGATTGTAGLKDTVDELEKECASQLKGTGYVKHPGLCYIPSYRTR